MQNVCVGPMETILKIAPELAKPKQNKMPSRILDLPEPFGPETTVKPGNSGTATVPPKDLKWVSSICLICTIGADSRERKGGTQILAPYQASETIDVAMFGCF